MSYLAQELITRSLYLSGIVARNAQTPTSDQINDGLFLLNEILDWKSIETDLIPYWTYYTLLSATPGNETYFIPNCVDVESVTFTYQTVRYVITSVSRRNYYATSRVNNLTTLPFNFNFDRQPGGGNLSLYFLPDQAYPLQIMAKFALSDVSLNTDLLTVFDKPYCAYLRYALAKQLAAEYNISFSADNQKILDSRANTLMYVSPPDLSMIKSSILSRGPALNFAIVNLSYGFLPT